MVVVVVGDGSGYLGFGVEKGRRIVQEVGRFVKLLAFVLLSGYRS